MSDTEKPDTGGAEPAAEADAKPVDAAEEAAPDAAEESGEPAEAEEDAAPGGDSPWAGRRDGDGEAQEEPEEPDYAARIAELNDRLLRALAETENLRRRGRREREETAKFAISGFARDVLSVADNLRRALDAVPGDAADNEALGSLVGGIELTERELATVFQRHGVEKIEAAGEKFDHNLHEAMFEIPTADAEPGTVIQVVETGYLLNGRLLRAARVGIARALPAPEPEPEPEPGEGDAGA